MQFSVGTGVPEKQRVDCVVVGVFANRRLSAAAKHLDTASRGYISKLLKRGDLDGRPGQSLMLQQLTGCTPERILLVGCGDEAELTAAKFREMQSAVTQAVSDKGIDQVANYLTETTVKGVEAYHLARHVVEAVHNATYRFAAFKTKTENNKKAPRRMSLFFAETAAASAATKGIKHGEALVLGMRLMRDLANTPANHCTPTDLAAQAKALQKRYRTLKVSVLEAAQMKKLGMGALLAVASGSAQPPKFIILEYRGGRTKAPVVLVGKGVTFDTGGISIKPAAAMDEMKYDMSGAASVLGTFVSALEMKLPVNLIGLIPATENMPGGKAVKPGDVVTSSSGQTIEILNTDAEGRLILCDALTYAERYKPAAVIDIATLTGACVVALGAHATGLLSNNDVLAAELLRAGVDALDRAWQLPLWDEYQKQLESPFADMANIGGREAGAITAACFLSKFARKFHWAHLDIAGTAWRGGSNKGSTGRPVPLLVQYLLNTVAAD